MVKAVRLARRVCFFLTVVALSACSSSDRNGDSSDSGGASSGTAGSGGDTSNGGNAGAATEFGLAARPPNTTCKDPGLPTEQPNDPFPKLLSATGCFSATDPKKPVVGLIPYGVASPLWSDNAEARRYMALPDGKKIKLTGNGDFDFPVGTVLLKTLALDTVMVETQFLIRHSDGQWGAYTYDWNNAGTDATLVGSEGSFRFAGEAQWVFENRLTCLGCHTEPVGRAIGPGIRQMNSLFEYGPNKRANQIETLDHIGLFETSPGDLSKFAALPVPNKAMGATIEQRTRSYLHANCSHCHQPGGTKDDPLSIDRVSLDLRFDTPLAMMGICNVVPSKNNNGIENVKLLSPGNAELGLSGELKRSMISVRMHSRDPNLRMPRAGSVVPDPLGMEIVDEWIKSVTTCP